MLDLGRQFRQRQRAWMEELRRHLYTPVLEAAVEGFTTFDRLRPETAESRTFRPMRRERHGVHAGNTGGSAQILPYLKAARAGALCCWARWAASSSTM